MYSSSPSVTTSISRTKSWSGNKIDDISNMATQKIYMISGSSDTTVSTAVMNQLYKYYVTDGQFIPSTNVVYKKDLKSAHTFPTDFDSAGNNGCGVASSPYISNCGFDGAGAILEHMYGTLQPRNDGTLNGKFIEFDQSEFLSSPRTWGMSTTGWVYVPKSCSDGNLCKLHIAYHGCLQGYEKISDKYVKNTGFNRWADTNNIIVIYPQAVTTSTQASGSIAQFPNLNGCWDWIGWYGADFDVKSGKQLTAMKKIIDRITGGFNPIAAPTGLQVTSTTDNSISLSWNQVSGANGYRLYRNNIQISASITTTTYTDTNLDSGSTYNYYVTAISSGGSESAPSTTVSGKTTGTPPAVQVPTGLTVADTTTNSITLTWQAAGGADSYRIYRDGNQITDVTAPTYTDTNLQSGTEYKYQVSSLQGTQQSGKSDEVKGTTRTQKICYNDNNYNHVLAGRAYQTAGITYANGSNQNMGLYNIFQKTNLCLTGQDYYVIE